MNTVLPAFRSLPAGIRSVIFSFGLVVPLVVFAEPSDESLLGAGLRSRPAYDGSASQLVDVVPIVRYFGHPWFVRSTQDVLEGGVRIELAPGLHAGAQLAYEAGRKARESDFLKSHNVSDIHIGESVGVQLEWDHKFGPMPVTLLARARQNTDSNLGAQADLRLTAGVYESGRFSAGIYTQSTWANAKSTGSFYGITPQQSSAAGLPTFRAGGGWLFANVGLLWGVDLSREWAVVGSIESRHLHGDAAHSPLVERGSNYYASAGLIYVF